jgi:hypothetical protein
MRRGLGTICTQVGGTQVCGSDSVPPGFARPLNYIPVRSGPIFGGGPTRIYPAWGDRYADPMGGGMNLAQLQAMLDRDPTSLTPAQFAALQRAGTVAGTVPYTSAALIPPTVPTAITPAPAAPAPVATSGLDLTSIMAKLQTPYAGLPLYEWLGIAAAGYFMFVRKKGR